MIDDKIVGDDKRVAYEVTASGGTKIPKTAKSGGGTTKDEDTGKDAAHPVAIKLLDSDGTTVKNVDVYGDGLAVFDKIPPGIYFMVETTPPTLAGKTTQYKPVEEMYRVVIAGNGTYSIHVANRNATTGLPEWTECETDEKKVVTWPENTKEASKEALSMGEGASAYKVDVYTALNVSPLSRKVILKKVDGADYKPLSGSTFTVLYADKQTVVRVPKEFDASGNPTSFELLEDMDSGAGGAFWIGKLPYGTYYLHETAVPDGYKKLADNDNWFILTVNENGVGYLAADAVEGTKPKNEINAEESKP